MTRVGDVRRLRNAVLGLVVLGAVLAAPVSAWGALSFPFDGQVTPAGGSFGFLAANSVAVSDFNGDTYAADIETDLVYVFDATSKEVTKLNGADTPAGSFGEASNIGVAVDN